MKTKKIFAVILSLVVIAACVFSVGCGRKNKTNTTTTTEPTPMAQYVHFRFADQVPTADDQMNATGGAYLGIYTGISATAPVSYSKYTWVRIKGEDGTSATATGIDGKDGQDGLSAYEIAVKNGFAGSEQEWLASLVGQPGQNGSDGIGMDGAPGQDGLSAYEIAVRNGFVGSEQDWLASLVGQAGTDGKDGKDGSGIGAHITSAIRNNPSTGRSDIAVHIDQDGGYVYMLKVYCNTYATPQPIVVEWLSCSPVNSITNPNRYYVLNGDPTVANSQVILQIPFAPYFKNYFESGDNLNIRISGIGVEIAQIEYATY